MRPLKAGLALGVLVSFTAGVVSYATDAQAGAKIAVAENRWLAVGLLLQPQFVFTEQDRVNDDGEETTGVLFDPMVRRTRIMVYGQFGDLVSFFMETDTPNFGYQQSFSSRTYIQDAYVELNFHEALQLDAGLVLPPFSHHGMQGATGLLALDYHALVVKPPPGATTVWRDVGFMLRGLLLDKSLEYRLSVTNGVQRTPYVPDPGNASDLPRDPLNDSDLPRLTARVTYNLFDTESGAGPGGMFWDGLYLKEDGDKLVSPKKIVSFGASASYQAEAMYGGDGKAKDYRAYAADVFVDMPLGDGSSAVSGQVDFYLYHGGVKKGSLGIYRAKALMAEAGYRMNKLQPVLGLDWYDVEDEGTAGDTLAWFLGLNYWIHGHEASIKVQVGGTTVDVDGNKDTNEDMALSGTVQTQIVF